MDTNSSVLTDIGTLYVEILSLLKSCGHPAVLNMLDELPTGPGQMTHLQAASMPVLSCLPAFSRNVSPQTRPAMQALHEWRITCAGTRLIPITMYRPISYRIMHGVLWQALKVPSRSTPHRSHYWFWGRTWYIHHTGMGRKKRITSLEAAARLRSKTGTGNRYTHNRLFITRPGKSMASGPLMTRLS